MTKEVLAQILFDELADESFYSCTSGDEGLADVHLDGWADLLAVADRVLERLGKCETS